MSDFYTNVQVIGNNIAYRGYDKNGRYVQSKIPYRPYVFIRRTGKQEDEGFVSLRGESLGMVQFADINEAREFIDQYKDIDSMPIYGNLSFEYAFIADTFKEQIEWDRSKIDLATIDIEVEYRKVFPDVEKADNEVTSIAFSRSGKSWVISTKDYTGGSDKFTYVRVKDEEALLKKFLDLWCGIQHPDAVTGWNVKFFDFPYLVARITKLFGEKVANKMSPWGRIRKRNVVLFGRDNPCVDIVGVPILDYMELFRKFDNDGKSQESYKLDAIANNVLGTKKVDYTVYGNLNRLFDENFNLHTEYNFVDIELIHKMDAKLKLIDLALTLAFDNKCNFDDVFAQVRMWDCITYNHLIERKIVVPPKTHHSKDQAYEGAYVKDPLIGRHAWLVSFDLQSLYPHLIMEFNVSPDCIVEPEDYTDEMRKLVAKRPTIEELLTPGKVDLSWLKDQGVTYTPNGQFFRIDKRGFLSEIMNSMYAGRAAYKRKQLDAEKEIQTCTDPVRKRELENEALKFNNLQLAKKVSLNSAYGSLGNSWFRLFDIRQAEAITMAGQLAIRWIGQDINAYMNKISKTEGADYVVASDTDSVYLRFGPLVDLVGMPTKTPEEKAKVVRFLDRVCIEKVTPFIDSRYKALADYLNAYEHKMIMKREVIADSAIWTAKKRYILNVWNKEGVAYATPKQKISGLEAVKSSTPKACRVKIKKAIEIMVNGTKDHLMAFIDEFRAEFSKLPVEEIAYPRSCNNVAEYTEKAAKGNSKGIPMHVKAAIAYNKAIVAHKIDNLFVPIRDGDKIKYIHLKTPNPFMTSEFAFQEVMPEQFKIGPMIDYDQQFQKAFVEPIKIITTAIGWDIETTSSLEGLFE
jgi:DNA polymerase elongation subunit (family B)